MILNVPVTATNLAEWVRRAATAINALASSQAVSEKAAVAPTVDSVMFRAVPLPASPVVGLTVLDEADGVLKVYANGAWRALF